MQSNLINSCKRIGAVLAIGTLLIAQACNRPDQLTCVTGNGEIDTDTRSIGSFDALASAGNYDVTIVQGEGSTILIQAESNLLQHIETKVDRGTLQLSTVNDRCISPTDRVRITVTVPALSGVLLNGSGMIVCDSLTAPTFNAELTGSGDIDLRLFSTDITATVGGSGNLFLAGYSPITELTARGSGLLDASLLESDTCYATVRGSGDLYTNCDSLLVAEIVGSGDLYYTGNPTIDERDNGSGELKMY